MMTEQEVKQLLIDTQAIFRRSLPFDICVSTVQCMLKNLMYYNIQIYRKTL